MKTQNRERQRNRKQRWSSKNRSDTVGISVPPFLVWDTIKKFHLYKKIIIVVSTLNSIGANHNIIAAALDFEKWKTFYGGSEWNEEDVYVLLKEFRTKKTKTNNIFWFTQ